MQQFKLGCFASSIKLIRYSLTILVWPSIFKLVSFSLTIHDLILCFQINMIQQIYSCLGPFYTMHLTRLKDKNENNKLVMYQNCNIKLKLIHIFNKFLK